MLVPGTGCQSRASTLFMRYESILSCTSGAFSRSASAGRERRGQFLVRAIDQVDGLFGDFFAVGGYRGDDVANISALCPPAKICSSWSEKPKRLLGTSAAVRTAATPDNARARLVSSRIILACGNGLRSNCAWSRPGETTSTVYVARPDTVSAPSRRGWDLPTTLRFAIAVALLVPSTTGLKCESNGTSAVSSFRFKAEPLLKREVCLRRIASLRFTRSRANALVDHWLSHSISSLTLVRRKR